MLKMVIITLIETNKTKQLLSLYLVNALFAFWQKPQKAVHIRRCKVGASKKGLGGFVYEFTRNSWQTR